MNHPNVKVGLPFPREGFRVVLPNESPGLALPNGIGIPLQAGGPGPSGGQLRELPKNAMTTIT